MKWRVLAVLVAVVVLQSTGCCRHCRCCGHRDSRIPPRDARKDEIPPPEDVLRGEGPARVIRPTGTNPTPPVNPQPTGAYGGS